MASGTRDNYEQGFDTKLAGTRLLGHDMAIISDPRTIQIVKEILDAETEELSQYKLVSDMMRETGMSDTRFDDILAQFMKLRQGFVEIGEKP